MKSINAKERLYTWMTSVGVKEKTEKDKLVDDFFTETCTKKIPSNWDSNRINKWKFTFVYKKAKEFSYYVGSYLQFKNMKNTSAVVK